MSIDAVKKGRNAIKTNPAWKNTWRKQGGTALLREAQCSEKN